MILDFVDPQEEYQRVCDRADAMEAAIDYALDLGLNGLDGLVWLRGWQEGDKEAMAELAAWREENSR